MDAAGVVLEANESARALFNHAVGDVLADLAVPDWLVQAHRRQGGAAGGSPALPAPSGAVHHRTFEAHPTRDRGAQVLWWLMEITDLRVAEEALRTERDRTGLLAQISSALLSSLNVERCTEVTARMAADHLADAAVIVGPAHGYRYP